MMNDAIKRLFMKGGILGEDSPFKQDGDTIRLHADSIQITKVGESQLRIGYFWRGNEMMWSTCEMLHGQILTIEFKPEVALD